MKQETDLENILEEAKKLHSDISDDVISELSNFLKSDSNKGEINPTQQKEFSSKLLSKLTETKNHEN